MTIKDIQKTPSSQDVHHVICLFDDEFSIDWIVELTELKPSEVLMAFEKGIKEGWLKQTATGYYSFSRLKKKVQLQAEVDPSAKEMLHGKIATLFLKNSPVDDKEALKLSTFLMKITNNAVGCRGLLIAGDAFVKSYQPDKALECYTKLKTDLLLLNGEEVDHLFIDMAIKYSKISTGMENTVEVIVLLKDAMKRALKYDDKASQALIYMHIAKNEWLLNRYDSALAYFGKGWEMAARCNDEKLWQSATTFNAFFLFWQGRFKEVLNHYEKALSDIEKHPQGGFPLLATITIGQCYIHTGQITQGLGMVDAILASCRKVGDKYTAAYAIGAIGSALQYIQSVDETLAYIEQSYDGIQQSRNSYIELLTDGHLSYLYYMKGDVSRSVVYLKKFVEKCREANIALLHHRPYILEICWAMAQDRYPKMMNLSLENEVKNLTKSQNVFLKGLAYRYEALLKRQANQPWEDITTSLEYSLKWLEVSGHELEIVRTRLEIIRQQLTTGDHKTAKESLLKISSTLSQYHDDIIPSDLRILIKGTPSSEHLLNEIYAFGREIMAIRDSKDLVQRIISIVNRLIGAERGAIFIRDEESDSQKLILRVSKNLTHEQVALPNFEASMTLIEQAATTGDDQISGIQDNPEQNDPTGIFSGEIIRSRICVPMKFREKVVGVMYHDNRLLTSAFKDTDVELLSFFATQAAIALDNVSTHEKIEQINQKIQEEKLFDEERHVDRVYFRDIIGKSDKIRQMLFLVKQVADTDTNVLILGETGVGKELVANAIHYNSSRRNNPFIKANCSALTETLINSELFGHERGAFTGANNRRIGRFELADGGTIFLDEIGDLPLEVQVNLLRVIQNNEFERVGGNETIRSDFRLITATNHDLDQRVREKKFRADLYYRLNVFPVYVPSLRERKEDIPLLVHHFIRKYCQKLEIPFKKISSGEMNKLIRYDWPGNIRELEHTIERGIILSANSTFETPELGIRLNPFEIKRQSHTLAENERNHILWALEQREWKVRGPGGAAEFLEIHPSTLTARMKKLGINRPPKSSRVLDSVHPEMRIFGQDQGREKNKHRHIVDIPSIIF